MLLETGEALVYSEASEHLGPSGKVPGVLYVTDRRLVYERHETGGVFRPGRVVLYVDVRLWEIQNLSVVHQLVGGSKLQVDTPRGAHTFRVSDPPSVLRLIVAARDRAHRPAPPPPVPPPPPPMYPPPPASGPAPVVVNVAAPAASQTIERQVVKVRCRHCGNLGDEVVGKCSRCGAPL